MFFSLTSLSRKDWIQLSAVALLFIFTLITFEWHNMKAPLAYLGGDQLFYIIFATLYKHPTFFNQGLFAQEGFLSAPKPVFSWMLSILFNWFGMVWTFRLLEVATVTAYVGATFACLYKLAGRKWVALGITLLSAWLIHVFPAEVFGVLSTKAILPRAIVLPTVPILLLAWIHFQERPKPLCLTYFAIGLISYFYPLLGFLLVPPMAITQLCLRGISQKTVLEVFINGLCALIPVFFFGLQLVSSMHHVSYWSAADNKILMEAFAYRFDSFWPPHLKKIFLPDILELTPWLIFGTLGFIKVRGAVRNYLLSFTLVCFAFFFGIFIFNYGLLIPQGHPPWQLFNLARITRMMVFPLVMMSTLYFAKFNRRQATLLLVACTAMTIFSVPRFVRHISKQTPFPRIMESQQQSMQERLFLKVDAKDDVAWQRQILGLTGWLVSNTSPTRTLVHVSSDDLRPALYTMAFAKRSVTYNDEIFGSLIFYSYADFAKWYQRIKQIEKIIKHEGSCSEAEVALTRTWFPSVTHVICKRSLMSSTSPVSRSLKLRYANETFGIYEVQPFPKTIDMRHP